MEIIVKSAKDVQTEVSFKNEHFTTTMDQILTNKTTNKLKKILKVMKKASANVNHY